MPGLAELLEKFPGKPQRLLVVPLEVINAALKSKTLELDLPDTTEIVDCQYEWDSKSLLLALYNPTWPVVPPGAQIPRFRCEVGCGVLRSKIRMAEEPKR